MTTAISNEADREKLRQIQTLFEGAVENNSIEDIRPFTHADFSFVSFTDKVFTDFDSFKRQWDITRKKMVGNGRFSTRLNPEPTLFTDDIAIAHGKANNTMIDNKGHQFDFTNHWTVIFKRHNTEWKVLRAHNSLDPFTNPMLVHGVKRKMMTFGLLSFVAGMILSSVFYYLF